MMDAELMLKYYCLDDLVESLVLVIGWDEFFTASHEDVNCMIEQLIAERWGLTK